MGFNDYQTGLTVPDLLTIARGAASRFRSEKLGSNLGRRRRARWRRTGCVTRATSTSTRIAAGAPPVFLSDNTLDWVSSNSDREILTAAAGSPAGATRARARRCRRWRTSSTLCARRSSSSACTRRARGALRTREGSPADGEKHCYAANRARSLEFAPPLKPRERAPPPQTTTTTPRVREPRQGGVGALERAVWRRARRAVPRARRRRGLRRLGRHGRDLRSALKLCVCVGFASRVSSLS